MKKLFIAIIAVVFMGTLIVAQAQQDESPEAALLKMFTRTGGMGGVTLNFVLLNNKTVDLLFTAPGKYAIRATANQATTFYVHGSTDKNLKVDNSFVIEQGESTINAISHNIKNFDGNMVPSGQSISGLLQCEEKIDLSQPFKIKGRNASIDFKLSPDALERINN